jgi:hypothetical protein
MELSEKLAQSWAVRLGSALNLIQQTETLSHSGFRGPKLGREIITRCAGAKSHTYDESWHRNKCHFFTI